MPKVANDGYKSRGSRQKQQLSLINQRAALDVREEKGRRGLEMSG